MGLFFLRNFIIKLPVLCAFVFPLSGCFGLFEGMEHDPLPERNRWGSGWGSFPEGNRWGNGGGSFPKGNKERGRKEELFDYDYKGLLSRIRQNGTDNRQVKIAQRAFGEMRLLVKKHVQGDPSPQDVADWIFLNALDQSQKNCFKIHFKHIKSSFEKLESGAIFPKLEELFGEFDIAEGKRNGLKTKTWKDDWQIIGVHIPNEINAYRVLMGVYEHIFLPCAQLLQQLK